MLSIDWPLTTAHRLAPPLPRWQLTAQNSSRDSHLPRRFSRHILVADAMIAVLADAQRCAQATGNGIRLRVFGNRPVKGRVRDHDLRQPREDLAAGFDRGDRRRIVNRGQILVCAQFGKDLFIHAGVLGDRAARR